MRKLKLFLTLLMLMCIGVTQMWADNATVGATLWAENFAHFGSNTPSTAGTGSGTTIFGGATITYAQSSTNTKGYNETLAGGTAPELLLAKSNTTWTISGIPTGGATEMALSFKSNKTTFGVTTSTANLSISGSSKSWTITVDAGKETPETFDLVIKNTGSSNARMDDVALVVVTAAAGGGETPPAYEITAQSNNNSYGTVSLSGSVIAGAPADGYRYASPAYTVTEGTATVSQNGDEFTVTPESDCTVRINFEIIPTHKISFNTGGLVVIADATDIQEGSSYNITQTPAASITNICEYGTFVGWTKASSITNPSVSPAIEGASIQMGNGDITLYAVYSKTEGGSTPVNDVLDRALTGVENGATGYSNWSGKKATSNAVYSGNSAGSNDAIQLRSNNSNSGIVTTTSGGNATKVTVDWESHTDAARTIDIYGKSTAYSAATDLYNSSNQGTKLGSITKSSGTELTITGEYAFIGIRSNSGALYLNSVTITWGGGGSTTYSLNPNCVEPECSNPTIGTQPVSAEYTKNAGSVTDLTVAATAATGTLEYQWYSNTSASNGGGQAIEGATNASYTPAVDVAGIFYYYCVVGIKDDVCKTASDVATITVKEDPTITTTDGDVEVGESLDVSTLFSSNSAGAITYSIISGDAATIEGSTLSAVKAGSVTVQASQEANGCYNAKTATATVTVTAPLPKITITADDLEDFAASYDDYAWSINGVQGIVGAYKSGGMQFNPTKAGYYAYNTTAIPGNITKIAMTKASGSTRPWTPYVSNEPMTAVVAGKNLEAKNVEGTVEWEVTGSNQYFYLQVAEGATVISSIVITYEPIYSAVTVDGEIAYGSVAVSGAEDLTAVAAGTELTLTNTPSDEYQLKDYNVFKTGEPATKITVTNGKFIMPTYAVTASAEFEESKELDHLVITSEASQKTFWVGEDFNYDGLAIKAVYDNDTEKENVTPKSISTPDMNEAGPKTVTIAYEEKGIEKTTSYEITVKALPTEANPASVAEILDIYAKFGATENMYVKGTIYSITGYYSSKYISYKITDSYDAEATPNHTNEFTLYNGLDLNGASFKALTDLEEGQEVVVNGNLTEYNNTIEFGAENVIISRPKYVKSIALSEGYKTAFNDDEAFSHEGVTVTATYNYGDDETVNATWSEPVMTQLGEQEVTVSYTYEGKTVEFKYTITITHVCAQENLVAVTKGEEVNGAYSLSAEEVCTEGDGATVDVTDIIPAEGYRFKEITATAGTVDNDLKKVTGIKAATTITVVFEQIPSYDVTWNVNGETSTTKVQEGSKPTFPNTPESCDATSTAFYGWATAPWTGKAENLNEKTVYTSAADMPEVMAAGTIYYAVFAKATEVPGEEHTLTLVESDFGLTTTYAEHTATKSGIEFTVNQGYKGSGNVIQMNSSKGTGSLYNTTAIAGLKSVTVNVASGEKTYDITTGTEQNPTANKQQGSATGTFNAVAGDTYFKLKVSGASYFSSIVVTYAEVAYEYSEFLTTCCTKYDITIDSEIEHGSVSADLAKACEGATVTLTPAADPAYHFDAWSVSYNDGENDHPVTVTENKFTMPAAAVTVSATFEHDPCQGLEKPALDGEIVVDYQSAIIAWNEVENASSYVLNITEGETPVVENASITDLTDLSYLVENLTANTTYNYSIMAVGDGIDYCATNTALEGNFTTVELPAAHLILSENGEEFEFEENQHKLNDVVTLPSELHYSGCTGKVLKGWSKAAVAEQDEEPTENYYAAGTQYTIGATADKLYAVFATEGAGQATTLFSETFDDCSGKGANDANGWSGQIASADLPSSLTDWTFVKGNAAYQCAKFGTGSAKGSAETPTIELTGAATLTFKAGAWNGGSEGTTLNLSATGATLDKSSVEMTKGAWTSYTVAITNANGSVKIKFEAKNASNNRFFLDDVVVSQSAISYSAYTTSCDAALEVPTFSLNPVVTPVEDEYQEAIHVVIATAVEGATIYYTTNGNVPTTESDVYSAPIALNTCGIHTIKAFVKKDAQESAIATATYTLAIPVPASDVTPFTPQQAIDVYNSGCYNNEQVHVKGVVTGASYNETLQNNAAAYNGSYNVFVKEIGDNSENPVTYEFYRMWKDNNNTAFTKGDIKAGDTITATGTMTKYQTTYEFNAGCYMESYVAYDEPKTDISNTVDNPYTVEVADGLIDNINSDLTKTVFVKGIVTSFPSSNKVIIRDTENGEEYLELYKSTLADGISALVIGDQIIVTGIMQKYNNQTYQMNEGCQVVWKKAKVVIEIAAMNMVVNDVATITPTSVTPEAAAEAITYSIKEGSEEYITLNGAQITATAAGTATIIATVETAETYIGTSIEFTVTVAAQADTRKTAQDLDGFAAISGDLNNEISFEAKKGDASTDPITYGSPAFIRIYQGGGYLAIDAAKGCTIDEVIITIPEGCNNTTIGVGTDEDNLPETGSAATAGNTFSTGTGMNSQHVYLVCLGTSKTTRLEIGTIVVKYTGEAQAVDHYSVIADNVVTTEFPKNGTFSSEGLVVYACYDANCEDYVDITDQCNVVADLTSIGEKKAEVYLGEEKLGEYDITVVAGQEDPALAYKRGEQVVTSEVIDAVNAASWTAPTLSMAFEVSPINYQTNNNSVLTVNGEGEIAWAGGYGTAKITASFAETEEYIASVATYTLTINEPANKIEGEWHKVTSITDITIGSKVIVANIAEGTDVKTMGAVSDNGKYRLEVASTVDNDGILSAEDGTKTFTLVDAGNGLYAFKGNNGKYLSAASSSSNDMKEVATVDANASWSISIEEGVATILAQGSYSRNWLRYNQTNTRFSCYASGQQDIALYVNRKEYVAPAVDPENPTPATPVAINTNVEEEEIVASGNVVVTVNTDNFEEPKSYIAQNGATIVINGNGAEEAKSVIADEQSTIQVNQPTTVNQVFSVSATMGAGLSGQITGVDNVTIAESTEAYFDITLGDNANPNKWHAIAVPFPVDAISGIYDAETGAKLNNEEHYAIMDYHGDIRATGAYGWKKYRSIMQPGVFYLMTVDGNTKTFRFKMSGTTLPNANSLALQLYAASGAGQSADAGWNGVANPTLKHGTVNQTVLVLNPTSYTYEDHDAGSYNFVVGTPFFIQANADAVATGMQMGAVDENKPYYAPKRVSENGFENIKVFFGNDEYKDKLTISANVEALNEYQIGKDLVKMTMTNTPSVAQIFGNAYDTKLCRVYAPMANDQAEYSLTLYAPNAGEYTISAPEMEDADIFLTYEGSIIWNLSMSEYTNDFAKGNNEGYGLILVKKAPQVITGVDNAEANEAGVQKVIINDHVYILRAEQMYDVTGKMVK